MAIFRLPDAETDRELIDRTLAGDGDAFATLVERFQRKIFRVAYAIVRDEARKADILFSTWGIEDLNAVAKTWQQNGGQVYSLPSAEAKRYVSEAVAAAAPLLKARPQLRQDYEALQSVAKKYRK